jgi:hypothetical protein
MADRVAELLAGVQAVNVGLPRFAVAIEASGGAVVQVDWRPPAGGDDTLGRVLSALRRVTPHGDYPSLDAANAAVVDQLVAAEPWLVDVIPAARVIPAFARRKLLLHAGPPIAWENMPGPMRGAVLGAILYEEWAADAAEAERLADSGEVHFRPCHEAGAVGPMGGIISPSMPVLVVENRAHGNRGYCTLNEGIGKVLRFGAYGPEVLARLCWLRDVLGPTLGTAVRAAGGIPLRPIVARALTMGDELHQRNVAASALLLREVAPWLAQVVRESGLLAEVLRFLGETEQFFLNVAMAYGKVATDAARTVQAGTVVTTMARNGVQFGIRMSGTGDRWFTAPVNTPDGMYFAGYSAADASPDMGDSAITETIGWGGVAMAAAPGVVSFVGAGGFEDALRITHEMAELCTATNPHFTVPTLGHGLPVGIDALKVVELGITPLINTGIAHREAGIGQIGAGTVAAPLACFVQAVRAYGTLLSRRVRTRAHA